MPTQRPKIKGFKGNVKKHAVMWSEEVVKAVYTECALELQRLKRLKESESNDFSDGPIPAMIVLAQPPQLGRDGLGGVRVSGMVSQDYGVRPVRSQRVQ